jgi:TonB-linked SusC/RagA family outer membrane protein
MNHFLISEEFQHFFRCRLKIRLSIEKHLITHIMRIGILTIAILTTTSIHLLFALPVKSQSISEVKIRIGLNNETVVQAFRKIEAQSPFHFMYRNEDISNIPRLSFPADKKSVEEFLKIILAGTTLTYRQIDDQILIMPDKKRAPGSNIVSHTAIANAVSGKINNSKGDPLAGVSITVKGANVGTSTDENGNYSISVSENDILVFSHVGYITQEIAVNSQSVINVKLEEEVHSLTEVVVTALDIKREAKGLTYSVQTVKSDEIGAEATSVINSLQGRIAGLTITKGNQGPGSPSKLLLRGSRSITGNNEPLYVTDGIPSNIGLIDGDNIESITVLKGASAAALYGSAGQNGAIIITTKKGSGKKMVVNYNGGMMFDRANIMWDPQYEYGQGDFGVYAPNSMRSWGPKASGQLDTLWNGSIVPYTAERNRLQHFFRTGKTLNNSISVTGGSDKMQTYFSYGNIWDQGIMRNNELIRHNLSLKINNNISRKLSTEAQVTYSSEIARNYLFEDPVADISRAPITIPLNEIKKYEYTDTNGIPRQNFWKPHDPYLGNPYFNMYKNLTNSKTDRLLGIFIAKYKFTDWLDVQFRGSIDKAFGSSDSRLDEDYYGSPIGSNYYMNKSNTQSTNVDLLLSFRRKLSDKFNLSGNLGGSVQDGRAQTLNATANGLYIPNYFYLSNAKALVVTTTDTRTPEVQAIYALASLSYRDYLSLDITARNDWSSALPKGSESYFYPSFGLSAILSDMLKLPSWVYYGKARVSLAYAGYGGLPYLGKNYYSIGAGGQIQTPTIQTFGTYKPEMTSSFEAGTEWQFFNRRLGFDFTYYKTETKNQLLLIGAPSASLFDQRYINAGLIQNSGVEMLVNLQPVETNRFSWDLSLNYARNNNKVIRITDEMKTVIISGGGNLGNVEVIEGRPYGEVFVKGWAKDSLGRRLVDNSGSPILTPGLNVYGGNYNPNYKMGLSNTFRYGNLSLSFLIDYSNGGIVISQTMPFLDADGLTQKTIEGREEGLVLDAYTAGGGKNDKLISAQSFWGAVGDRYPTGELYTYSATNMRLRELTLRYTIVPKNRNKQASFVKMANISLVGRNLFFLKNDAPFDPEVTGGTGNSGGLQQGWLPATRTFGFNVNLSF